MRFEWPTIILDRSQMAQKMETRSKHSGSEVSSVTSYDSIPPHDPYEYLAWFEARNGPVPRSWPALVGDCVQRAAAIIRYASPFYVVLVHFKEHYEYGEPDPLRVVLHLDLHGYVAHTPVVG